MGRQSGLLEGKVRNVLILPAACMKQMVEHCIDHRTGKYDHFILVADDEPAHAGHCSTLRDDAIDPGLPRRFGRYDELATKT